MQRTPHSTEPTGSPDVPATTASDHSSGPASPASRRRWFWRFVMLGAPAMLGLLLAGSHGAAPRHTLSSRASVQGQHAADGSRSLATSVTLLGGSPAGSETAPFAPAEPPENTPPSAVPLDGDLARDARVVGRVLDATGGPIPGARVQVHFEEQALARYRHTGRVTVSPAPDDEWITDARGRFEGLAPGGRIGLAASAEAYSEVRRSVRAPAADVVLVLAPGARVSGRVQRGDGSPVSGASLQIQARGFGRLPVEGQSDERGEFSIAGVPAGVVEVAASAAGLSSAREWLRLTLAEVAPPVVLTLTAAHSIYGVVRAPDGSICPAGMVRAGGRLGAIAMIDDGRYRIDGLDDGTHELSVTCHGVAAQTRSISVSSDSPPSLELNWQLEAALSVSGTVQLENGEPLVGAIVWLHAVPPPAGAEPDTRSEASADSTFATCNTGADGAFTCGGLRPGWYRVNTGTSAGASASSEPVRLDAQSQPEVALIVPDGAEVRVRVAGDVAGDPGGLFARGVFARGAGPLPIPATPRADAFVFENLALGRYRIAIGRAAAEPGPSAVDVELTQPGQVIEVELRAPDALTINGSVVDAAGEPVPDAWVQASLLEPDFPMPFAIAEPVLSSAEGRFEIGDLPPGRYALSAVHAGGEARKADVAAGQSSVRLVVEGYGSLSGTVLASDGQPARDFSVLVIRDPPGEPLSVEGVRGRWELPWVAPGGYRIVILSSSGGASAKVRVSTGNDTPLMLRLDPALAGKAILGTLDERR